MKKVNIIWSLCLALFIMSCDSFLDVNPDAEVVNDDMFDNVQGCEDAITGIYGKLKSNEVYGEYYNWGIFDLLSQDLGCSSQVTPQYYFTRYDYSQAATILESMWQVPYEIIGYVNNAIDNLERKSEGSYPLLNLYKGELYALRAMLHFDLVKSFAPHVEKSANVQGIPYVTEYSFKHTPFSTVGEVYEKIIIDLKKAQTYLEEDKDNLAWPRTDTGNDIDNFMKYRQTHLNYYATTGLLARVLRMKGDYADARTEALKVIDSGRFPLASKDEMVTLVAGTLSQKETLFGVYSTKYVETTKLRLYDGASWTSFSPYQASSGGQFLFDFNEVYSNYLGDNAGLDGRLEWIRSLTAGGTSYRLLKNVDVTIIESAQNTPSNRRLVDGISLMRVPEMYYIVAEAYLRENKLDEAADYLNPVLVSRGLTRLEDREPALTPSLDLLYNERYKELYGEGQRWFDMKKLNAEIRSNAELKVIPASDKVYVFPIPEKEFEYRTQE